MFPVTCGPGSYYDKYSETCELCEIGWYTLNSDQTTCVKCGTGNTTLQKGSSQVKDCVGKKLISHMKFLFHYILHIFRAKSGL